MNNVNMEKEQINVAELLKDCPKGMELYSPMFGTVIFEGVRDTGRSILIDVTTSSNTSVQFYYDGKFNTYYTDSEVTLFPTKGKTWEEFVPPCQFKVGDRIKSRITKDNYTIIDRRKDFYVVSGGVDKYSYHIPFSMEDNYELLPDNFDITTLKPFDKVFVRDTDTEEWCISFFSHCNEFDDYTYHCINGCRYGQCIPYEHNEHLLGTADACEEFYKVWKQ